MCQKSCRSGNHALIDRWRQEQSLKRTFERRPDLLADKDLTEEEMQLIKKFKSELDE